MWCHTFWFAENLDIMGGGKGNKIDKHFEEMLKGSSDVLVKSQVGNVRNRRKWSTEAVMLDCSVARAAKPAWNWRYASGKGILTGPKYHWTCASPGAQFFKAFADWSVTLNDDEYIIIKMLLTVEQWGQVRVWIGQIYYICDVLII